MRRVPSPSRGGAGWGWGPRSLQLIPNPLRYRFRLEQNFVVPEPHDAKPGLHQEPASSLISSDRISMLAAVHFYHEFCRKAHEVQNVIPKHMLPPKLPIIELLQTQ